jgi:hypothetical protein
VATNTIQTPASGAKISDGRKKNQNSGSREPKFTEEERQAFGQKNRDQ